MLHSWLCDDVRVALQAWNGTGEWTHGKQLRAMRGGAVPDVRHAVPVLRSRRFWNSIACPNDQQEAGGIGPQRAEPAALICHRSSRRWMTFLVTWRVTAPAELLSDQPAIHTSLDGMAQAVSAPAPFVAKLGADHAVQFVVPSDKEIAALRDAMPGARHFHGAGRHLSVAGRRLQLTVGLFEFPLWRTRTCRTISTSAALVQRSTLTS